MAHTEQQANIKSCVLLQKSPSEMLTILQKAYGDRAMKKLQVYDWQKWFCEDWVTVDYDPLSGSETEDVIATVI